MPRSVANGDTFERWGCAVKAAAEQSHVSRPGNSASLPLQGGRHNEDLTLRTENCARAANNH